MTLSDGAGIEQLESRRLLSFSRYGEAITLASAESDVAVAADGSATIAYEAGGIQLARYAPDGQVIGQPVSLYTQKKDFSGGVSIAVNPSGDAVVAYVVHDTPTNSIAPGLYVNRISRDGTVSTRHLLVGTDEVGTPSVSIDNRGGYFVAYIDTLAAHVKAFDANGVQQGSVVVGVQSISKRFDRIRVAATPDLRGAVYALDFSVNDSTSGGTTIGRMNHGDLVGKTTTVFGERSSLSMFPDGTFALMFQQYQLPNETFVQAATFVQKFSADLTPTPLRKATQVALQLDSPIGDGGGVKPMDIVTLPDGGYAITYVQTLASGNAATTDMLYVERYTASDQPDEDGPIALVQASEGVRHLYLPEHGLAVDSNGNVLTTASYRNRLNTTTTSAFRLTTRHAALNNGTLYVFGTSRNDSLSVKARGSRVLAALGDTTLRFAASSINTITMHGKLGNDRIFNETSIRSAIHGDAGDDELQGGSSNDEIFGGNGNDRSAGNRGHDTIWGQNGNDYIRGGSGDDKLDGAGGIDIIFGDAGHDSIWGGAGNDRLYSGADQDTIYGGGADFFSTRDDSIDRLVNEDGSIRGDIDSTDVIASS